MLTVLYMLLGVNVIPQWRESIPCASSPLGTLDLVKQSGNNEAS